ESDHSDFLAARLLYASARRFSAVSGSSPGSWPTSSRHRVALSERKSHSGPRFSIFSPCTAPHELTSRCWVGASGPHSCPRVVRGHLLLIRKHGITQIKKQADSCPLSHGHRVRPHGRESSDSPCGGRTLSVYTVSACPPQSFQADRATHHGQLSD